MSHEHACRTLEQRIALVEASDHPRLDLKCQDWLWVVVLSVLIPALLLVWGWQS